MTILTDKRKNELISFLWDHIEKEMIGNNSRVKAGIKLINLLADNYLEKVTFTSAYYYDLHNYCTDPFVKMYLLHDINIDEYTFIYDYISDKINTRLKNKKYDRKE